MSNLQLVEKIENTLESKTPEQIRAETLDIYAKTFAFAVSSLESLSKSEGGSFVKTSVSAVWYNKEGCFERVWYDPDLALDGQSPLPPTAETYLGGADGLTMGLMDLEDVSICWPVYLSPVSVQ